MEPILEVNNLTKIYRKASNKPLKAVDKISFTVEAGEVVGFLGPNGAGKSTAIKMITGIAHPTSGSIAIMGHDITKERERAMTHVGGVIESPDLYVDWTGYENLAYFASLHPRSTMEGENTGSLTKKQLNKQRIQEVLDIVGMSSRQKEKVKRYSLGMKQRLGVSQALLNKPRLLILDEPANGLDPAGIKDIRDLLKKLAHEHGMAVLVSSHQLAEMQLMCDRVLIINKGSIVAEKKITELNDFSQGQTVVLTTDKPVEAADILKQKFGLEASTERNTLTFMTDMATSEITRELVLNGINIYGVQTKEGSLEDLFISLTKGGSINV